ncbi:MAG: glycoside hydrolase family 5 protein [Bacilli bacterium]|nr:glycoside hydrolase family 5 protein [Bacilli bacterium]
MKKLKSALVIATIFTASFGFFLTFFPGIGSMKGMLGFAYLSFFRFDTPYGTLDTILLLYGVLAFLATLFLCIKKKAISNIYAPIVFLVSIAFFLMQSKPLTDGLPLMGFALLGCIFAFLSIILSHALLAITVLGIVGVNLSKKEEKPGFYARKKPLTKGLFGSLACLLIVVISLFGVIGVGSIVGNNVNHDVASHVDPGNNRKAYFAKGRGTYDLNGDLFTLKGVNFGNYFMQEGWLSPFSLGEAKNEDGSYKKVNEEGIVEEYEEMYQEEMIAAMRNNPNLSETKIASLWDAYYKTYATGDDFVNIKSLGMNGIRLPMYYGLFMEGNPGALTFKANAFYYLDRFLDMAKENGLVVVLDMHGVEGGQSGYEHSGSRKCEFWDNLDYQKDMASLWKGIASHYKQDRPDLYSTIFGFDLVNEPGPKAENGSFKKQWDVMDKMYKAIREVDTDHIVIFEGVWDFSNLPDHKAYSWENVVYEFHFYNWNHGAISDDLYWNMVNIALSKADNEVPFYIGEFNFFEDEATWLKMLDQFEKWNYSWTMWTYKLSCVGWWDNSWGIYINKMNLKNKVLKLDLRDAKYEELLLLFSNQTTSLTYNETGFTYKVLKKHFGK